MIFSIRSAKKGDIYFNRSVEPSMVILTFKTITLYDWIKPTEFSTVTNNDLFSIMFKTMRLYDTQPL